MLSSTASALPSMRDNSTASSLARREPRIATNLLRSMGYANAREYIDGKKDWIEAGLPVEASPQRRAG